MPLVSVAPDGITGPSWRANVFSSWLSATHTAWYPTSTVRKSLSVALRIVPILLRCSVQRRLLTPRVQALRKVFWAVIVDGKNGLREETTFDFKYIPDLHKTTQMEEGERSGIRQSGIERRNLQTLVLGVVFVSIAAVVGFRVVSGLVGHLVG